MNENDIFNGQHLEQGTSSQQDLESCCNEPPVKIFKAGKKSLRSFKLPSQAGKVSKPPVTHASKKICRIDKVKIGFKQSAQTIIHFPKKGLIKCHQFLIDKGIIDKAKKNKT